jgi:NAD(P)-dependent dehydrogenase (short-subunit alcohol dehydrogenase family)
MFLRGKVAVVAGFGPGVPRRSAVALAREGADLVVFGPQDPVMVATAGEIAALGRKALCVPAASLDRTTCAAMARRVDEIFGRVDVLVHAGSPPAPLPVRFEDADLDDWHTALETDLFGPLQLTQALLPLLLAAEEGARVVLIGSRSGALAPEGFGAYTVTQAALAAATRTLARELGANGIRVNVVEPGYVAGDPVTWTVGEAGEDVASRNLLGSVPTPEGVAGAVVFLASPLSQAVTGQALRVDAGHWIS